MRKFVTLGPAFVVLMTTIVMLLAGPAMMRRYSIAQQHAQITLARNVLVEDDILRRIDRAVSAIADAIEPSVVHIEAPNADNPNSFGSTGAGWVYDNEGHIVTNAHVVRNATQVAVEFFDGRVVRGTVLGKDPYTDIAVIRINDADGLFIARRSMERLPRRGERVYAFGSPFGFKFSMSEGIVSGLGRQAPGSNVLGGYTNYIQTDAAVNPGNSGGPLVNTDGHVVGMSVAIATARSIGGALDDSGGDSAGISFAIPLGTIEPIVSQIIRFGSVAHGYLGITYDGRPGMLARATTESGDTISGIMISGLERDGPSENAGMLIGDVIVAVEDSPILVAESLSTLISSGRPGDTISVRVYRNGQPQTLRVQLGEMRPQVLATRIAQPVMLRMGMQLSLTRQLPGESPLLSPVRITRTWDGLSAAIAGLQIGDEIIAVDNTPVQNQIEFFTQLADRGFLTGETVTFTVLAHPSQDQRDVRVTLYP